MSTETPPTPEGPKRLPVVTMIGVGLFLLLFVGLVGLMFYINSLVHKPTSDDAERTQKLQQLKESDKAFLNDYGKGEEGTYRIPINRAMDITARELNEQASKAEPK